jgi:hypothetical protein
MSNNPTGKQGPKRTTAMRLADHFAGGPIARPPRSGPAHLGVKTGLGGHAKRDHIGPAPDRRMADHEDCVRYPECLEAAAHRPGAACVCAYPCGRYEHLELHADAQQRTNYPSMQQISEALG